MLNRIYHGTRLDLDDLVGVSNVLHARIMREEREEFHSGALAAVEMFAQFDMRDQSEFFEIFDALYNEGEEFYKVKRQEK